MTILSYFEPAMCHPISANWPFSNIKSLINSLDPQLNGFLPFWDQNRLENTDPAIFSQINVQTHHWGHHFEACRPPDESLHVAQAKEPLVPAALLHFFLR